MARAQAFDNNMQIARYYTGDKPIQFVKESIADGLAAVVVQTAKDDNARIYRADGSCVEFSGHVPGMWDAI